MSLYVIANARREDDLMLEVEALIKLGYVPTGGIMEARSWFWQAMWNQQAAEALYRKA